MYANLYYYRLKIGEFAVYGVKNVDSELYAPPVLKNGVTFVPAEVIEIIKAESGLLAGFNVR